MIERGIPLEVSADEIPWKPTPGPQTDAYESKAFETLYGGAAGGGKSDLLLGLARLKHHRVLLLRRIFPDLERSLILRSLEFYGDQKHYNGGKHVWNIDNRRIEFGHLAQDKSIHQYQSAQYDLIGFDELTQFTETQYVYLISRARTRKGLNRRVRVVACTNPGGEGNDWVMMRWAAWLDPMHANPAKPGELRWYKRNEEGREVETTEDDPDGVSRTFIAAKLADNPYLDEDYRKTLNLLPEPYRSQLLNGDWQAGLTDDAYQVIPRAWVRAAQNRWQPVAPAPLDTLGCDPARGGDDKTVIAPKHGTWFDELVKIPGRQTPDGMSVVSRLVGLLRPGVKIHLDVIGIGASVYDIGRMNKMVILPINFAQGSTAVDRSGQLKMRNKRAEVWWKMREALDPEKGENIALPPDPELLADLVAPRWSFGPTGITIEDKEDIKERLGRSPDCGDAVVMAHYKGATANEWINATQADIPEPVKALQMPEGGNWNQPPHMIGG